MNYRIKEIDEKTIIFEFNPPNIVLSLFLEGDFTNFQKELLVLIESVLSGDSKNEEFTGNATHIILGKNWTFIEDSYLEEETTSCTISTRELRSLMDEWQQKRAEFLKSKRADG